MLHPLTFRPFPLLLPSHLPSPSSSLPSTNVPSSRVPNFFPLLSLPASHGHSIADRVSTTTWTCLCGEIVDFGKPSTRTCSVVQLAVLQGMQDERVNQLERQAYERPDVVQGIQDFVWLIYIRVSTMTAIRTVGHILMSTPTNGHRFTALDLPWRSPIQV